MRNFRELEIWKQAISLVNDIYNVSKRFPDHERFALASQIQRTVVSIPSNISEGCSRNSNKEFIRFLEIAIGSSFEVETQLIIAQNQKYILNEEIDSILVQLHSIQAKINSFISSVKNFK